MFLIGQRKQKKALLKNAANLQKIHDEYYELKSFTNIQFDRPYVVKRHVHLAKDIMARYGISSMNELLFLLHRHAGEVIKICKFCGHTNTKVKTRSKYFNEHTCDCHGLCITCKKPYRAANDDGVCYSCKPYIHVEQPENLDEPYGMMYRFFQYIGRIGTIERISDLAEAKRMMKIASHYYYAFQDMAQKLENDAIMSDDQGATHERRIEPRPSA